jgi:hypothetical protein
MSLFSKAAKFARSPQGQRAFRKASQYAQSPKGKRQIASVRERLASRRSGGGRPGARPR